MLDEDIFHTHLAVGVADVDLSGPILIGSLESHTHVGDAHTVVELVVDLVAGVKESGVQKNTARRLDDEFAFCLFLGLQRRGGEQCKSEEYCLFHGVYCI